MEAPDLCSDYLYSADSIRTMHTESAYRVRNMAPESAYRVRNMAPEYLSRLSRILKSNKRLVEELTESIKELRISINYHHVLIILNFAHRSETLFKEILQREWPSIVEYRILISGACTLAMVLSIIQVDTALKVDTPEIWILILELLDLDFEALHKGNQLRKMVARVESQYDST